MYTSNREPDQIWICTVCFCPLKKMLGLYGSIPCTLGKFSSAVIVCCFLTKFTLSKISLRNTIRLSNSLDPDQDRQNVCLDLGPNSLQKLSADHTSTQKEFSRMIFLIFINLMSPFQILGLLGGTSSYLFKFIK